MPLTMAHSYSKKMRESGDNQIKKKMLSTVENTLVLTPYYSNSNYGQHSAKD
jgi:hypothetical protein